MKYHCKDCSYKGKKPVSDGRCPACGSYNYRRPGASAGKDGEYQQSNVKLAAVVVLWGILIYIIYRKLYG